MKKKMNSHIRSLPPMVRSKMTKNFANGDKKIALVIDDDTSVCEAVSLLLADMGVIGIVKRTSGEMYDILHTLTPDLIFMDYWLSGGENGLELTHWLRKETDFKKVPIIFMTAMDEIPDGLRKLKKTYVLNKPFSINNFMDLIYETLKVKA